MSQPSLNLQPCALSDLGELHYRFARSRLPQSQLQLLVVALEGAAGNEADEIFDLASAIVMAGLEAWQPWAAILDFRGLAYSWGDRMQNVLLAPQRWYEPLWPVRKAFGGERVPEQFPFAVLTSELNREGLVSLLRDEMNLDPRRFLFETPDAAARVLDESLEGVTEP